MSGGKHVVRFGRSGWRCSCGVAGKGRTAAEAHAFDTRGRIELGRDTLLVWTVPS